MTGETLNIKIENASRTDFLELRRTYGTEAVTELGSSEAVGETPVFGEPASLVIALALAKVGAGAFVGWLMKQREFRRTALRITITTPDGTVVQVDLSDPRVSEGGGANALAAELAKAGITIAADHRPG
jgi:hypothetical protein